VERHLATVWESVVDAVPEQIALVQGDVRRSFAEFDDRAARLAAAFTAAGLGPGSKVALYLYNSPEYLESYFAALKIRAVPINVNYRYLEEELLYLLDNAEAEALVFHSELGARVGRVRARAPRVRLPVVVDDGSGTLAGAERYDDVVAAHAPAPRISRSPDDVTMLYTGGTTGMPKGVMSRIGGAVESLLVTVPPALGLAPLTDPSQIAPTARVRADQGQQWVSLPACPLMHGTGIAIGTIPATTYGGKVVFLARRGLDAGELWSLVERERVNGIAIVGDAFARPLLRELQDGVARDLTSLRLILSAGAMFSVEVRRGLLELLPAATIVDYIAASEGYMGVSISTKDRPAPTGRFLPAPGVRVLAEDGRAVEPGSGEMGMVAVSGTIPLGYYKDGEKTARTFREYHGVRYSLPGDWATVESDGTIALLGRGSQCINTGGEKVFPEEVEEIVKQHDGVDDCLVFGVPDERFGQRVVGVVSLAPASTATPERLIAAARERLASYKVPRALLVVDTVPRGPNGKADYPAARALFDAANPGPR
jgi:fatty-acyl-CoA synthase